MLGLPLAFILSQDQTLHCRISFYPALRRGLSSVPDSPNLSRLPACRSWFPLTSHEGNDGSFLFYPWTFLKEETTSKKTSKLLYYFLSLCKTFNELFHLPPPLRSGHTRPCFPKASAKVQPFTLTAKRLPTFSEPIPTQGHTNTTTWTRNML